MQQEHDLDNPEKILATSGESFFWARRFLGKKMGHDAAVLYSFCRVLDDMADGDLPDGFKHLSTIQASLEKGEWNDHALLRHHAPMVNEYNLPKDVIASLVEGLMDDQADEVLLPDEESLIQYAYKVAGTVGLLMCEILNNSDPKAKPHAVDLGIAMQLTNIARDVVEDARMGRRYLPGSWVGNMSPEDILDAALDPYGPDGVQITRAVERLLDLAESYYASGRAGLAYLPARAHFSIGVAAKVYRQIGRQLLRSKDSWHGKRQVTSKGSKMLCTVRATANLVRRLPHARRPHNTELHTWLKPYMHHGGGW
ncbi:MAG: phytoene/squalene synthase family protein [Candidatus Thermoplasmatota archaeon]|nr:phytoene/squalene synthase family protein [Candidatus Thermoplasmatota archaeon]MEC8708008.1 phytoene/squalene synthase family protein [Candidatus Thermoplasmatota archaeon]